MTKKRFLIAIAIVMVLILSVAVFVACNENQTKSYTVKFVDGESEIKSVSVEEGKTITDADIPADLTKDGYVFEGWYVGDVAFDKSAAITADVTYSAKWTKLHTVKFVDGDETIKTATVKDGEKLKDADVPADLTATGKAFEGWFDGTTAFDKDATITADKTFAAKWVGLFNVTFKNGEETIKVAQVKDGAVIAAADIPEDLTDDNYAFIGWFVGETAYDGSAAVTSDIVVSAKFSTIYKSYFGTWHGATDDWDAISYTVVVDATSITVTIGDADAQAATDIDVDATDGTVMFKLGDTEYMLYANYDGNLCIYESSEIKLSAELEGRVHVSSTDIVGTYTTEGGHTIVINKTFAKVDDVLGVGFYYSESSGYSWSIGSNYSSLTFDSATSSWIYKENHSSDDDNVIVPELVAIDIPAEFIGNWYGTFESFGSTSYFLVKVTADGVFAYTPGSGFAKVGVATEYKDGKLTVVGLDETITASIADGKLAYKSDAAYGADYQLEKGTVVVFENNYSVFYIAKLGADGKIDMDSFALEDPTMAAGYTFRGWYSDLDFVTEFDEDADFAESAVFASKSEKTGYVLTFKKSASDSEPVVVVVDKATGKLTADQIPADLTYEDGSVFTGWYTSAGVKAVADLTISDDTTFIAKSVKESDYEGYWINTTKGKEALAIIADGTITFGKDVNGLSYTLNTTTGALEFSKTIDHTKHSFSIVKTSSGITITESYYDRSAEEDCTDTYELVAVKATSNTKKLAGTYQEAKNNIIVILENGIVTKYDGSDTVYGIISGSTSITISYKSSSASSVTTVTGKYDAKSLIINGKIYVKNPSAFASYYNSNNGTFYVYTREGKTTLYTYKGTSYATIDGELAIGNVVTVSYTDADGKAQSFVAKITSATAYDAAGAERGTYTSEGADNLVLDGFGTAKLGEAAETTYTVGGQGYIIIGDSAYVLEDGKYTVLTDRDGYQGSFTRSDSKSFSFTLDGFGGVIAKSYSYTYTGTYSINDSKTTLTIADCYSSFNGTYSLEEDANVLVSSDKVFIKDGYTVSSKLDALLGYWKSADGTHSIEIVKASSKVYVKLDGTVYTAKGNYNNSILTISVDGKSMTITKDGEGIAYAGADSSIALASATLTFDVDTTKLEGTWELFDYYYYTFTFGADGKLVATRISDYGTHTETVNYIVNENVVKFSFYYEDFICTLADGALAVVDDGVSIGSARKIADPASSTEDPSETLDAFAGTWVGKPFASEVTLVCDGKGSGTFAGNAIAYTVKGDTIEFECGGCACVVTKSGDKLSFTCDDAEYMPNFDLTKRA